MTTDSRIVEAVGKLISRHAVPAQHVYWRADGRAAMILVPARVMDTLYEVSLSADDENVYVDSGLTILEPADD
jgi:hypothetical protein